MSKSLPNSRSLPNYIRSLRRKNSVSQKELARLTGGTSGTSVLRHEANQRTPHLDTALAYAHVLGIDPRELFAGRFEDIQVRTQKNAKRLLRELEKRDEPIPPPKLELLYRLTARDTIYFVPCGEEECPD